LHESTRLGRGRTVVLRLWSTRLVHVPRYLEQGCDAIDTNICACPCFGHVRRACPGRSLCVVGPQDLGQDIVVRLPVRVQ
jgi:hypothetical protein